MSDMKIEKGVPMPKNKRATKYPFAEMEVGDSFYVEPDNGSIHAAASWYGKRNNKKFATRKEGEGRRIWRIE